MANVTKVTVEKIRDFLDVLRETANVSRAAKAIGVSRKTVYELRKTDKDFASDWDDALAESLDYLEEEARRRAFHGADKEVFYQGVACGVVKEYSDSLLIFLLKSRRPEVFSEKVRQEITGKDGAAIEISSLSTEQKLARIAELLELARARRDLALGSGASSPTS
jgi:hypothetical protein